MYLNKKVSMRKLFITMMLLVCFNTHSQYTLGGGYMTISTPTTTINLRLSTTYRGYNSETRVGPYLVGGGAALVLVGLLTPPIYVGGSTTIQKPFTQQMRNWVMITGCVVGTVGLVLTISGN